MESRDQLSMDPTAIAETVQSCPVVTSMTISDSDDGNDGATNSPVLTSMNNVTSPHPSVSKRVVEKELRQPFPVKVYEMLENADEKQFSHVVSWNATGTGFMVHDKEHFTREIVPDYFNLTKYKSFQRQLSLYGFQRVTVGPNKGLRFHEKLRKGEAELVRQMKPIGYKPRNLARLLEQQERKKHQQQKVGNITTTTTTTVVNTTTTSTTMVVTEPLKNSAIGMVIDTAGHCDLSAPNAAPSSAVSEVSSTISLPPVVSTNSLIKPEDQEGAVTAVSQLMAQRQNNDVHAISPEPVPRNAVQLPSGMASSENSQSLNCQIPDPKQVVDENQGCHQDESRVEPEIVYFEGMCFYPMCPTRELGINVKLKLLEEFNPTSSLLLLASKYVTPGYTTKPLASSVTTIPVSIDAVHPERPSLVEPFTDLVNTAAATSTASTIAALQKTATSTASAIAALKTAASNAAALGGGTDSSTSATPSLLSYTVSDVELEHRCTDALDFHTINVTATATAT